MTYEDAIEAWMKLGDAFKKLEKLYFDNVVTAMKAKKEIPEQKEPTEGETSMRYLDWLYDIVEKNTKDISAIYDNYIIYLVGHAGFDALVAGGRLTEFGQIEDQKLYILVDRTEF